MPEVNETTKTAPARIPWSAVSVSLDGQRLSDPERVLALLGHWLAGARLGATLTDAAGRPIDVLAIDWIGFESIASAKLQTELDPETLSNPYASVPPAWLCRLLGLELDASGMVVVPGKDR